MFNITIGPIKRLLPLCCLLSGIMFVPVPSVASVYGVGAQANRPVNQLQASNLMMAEDASATNPVGLPIRQKKKMTQPVPPSTSAKKMQSSANKRSASNVSKALHAAILRNASAGEQAFANATRILMPMNNTQIETLHSMYDSTQRAINRAVGAPPRPTTTELIVNTAPGSTPPVIRLSAGYVSSLVFLDASSAPWPIEWVDVGNPSDYNVQWDKKSNTLLIQALNGYRPANMALKLRGMQTPIMLTLVVGQKVVDYRVDLRVPGLGPNAHAAVSGINNLDNPILLSVLNGVPPSGSRALTVKGGAAQAWLIRGSLYLRTRYDVLSPGWISKVSSGDGTHVYVMSLSPVILAMSHGKMMHLHIQR